MSNDLIPIIGGLASAASKEVESLTKTSDFLPQIRVYGASSDLVKEGKFPMGHLGMYFTKDNIADLGEAFDCLVIDWRPRTSIVSGDSPISFYGKFNNETGEWDCSNEEFQEVKDLAMKKTKGYLAGLEYLLYVPSIDKFALFLFGSPTLRRESANVCALTRKAATIKIHYIKTTQYSWHGVQVFECTTPFDMPSVESITEEVVKFRSPPQAQVELDTSEEGKRAR